MYNNAGNTRTPPTSEQFRSTNPVMSQVAASSRRTISSPDDLKPFEKMMLLPVLRRFKMTRPRFGERDELTDEEKTVAIKFIFQGGWNARMPMGGAPSIAPRSLKQGPPPAEEGHSRKRRSAEQGFSTTPNTDLTVKECRKKGAPVFLSPSLNFREGDCQWVWKDAERGNVDFLPGMDILSAKAAAVIHYDDNEIRRSVHYNQQLAQWIMRRYVVYWQSFPAGGDQAPPMAEYLDQFENVYLVSDLCETLANEWTGISNQVRGAISLASLTALPK
ncbi:hypothetical protein HJFPF1_11609 [Paramyrothecium foliicola]|nr:hypothetical protein HJFPF1_11609 [Paramyrothecium foliicola]